MGDLGTKSTPTPCEMVEKSRSDFFFALSAAIVIGIIMVMLALLP